MAAVVCALLVACGKDGDHAHGHHDEENTHAHDARHGGIAIVLGDEEFHVEFTHGGTPGVLHAYFFDGHMENYVRTAMPAFSATAKVHGQSLPVVFAAVADRATGETVGDTALFEAKVAALRDQPSISLEVPELVVRGTTYTNITAEIPAAKSL